MEENEAFTIPFITKKTIKKQSGFTENFLETSIQSIWSYLSTSFFDVPSLKNVSTPRFEQTNDIKQWCFPRPLSFKNSLKANINIY